jgi:hypothetical protein
MLLTPEVDSGLRIEAPDWMLKQRIGGTRAPFDPATRCVGNA